MHSGVFVSVDMFFIWFYNKEIIVCIRYPEGETVFLISAHKHTHTHRHRWAQAHKHTHRDKHTCMNTCTNTQSQQHHAFGPVKQNNFFHIITSMVWQQLQFGLCTINADYNFIKNAIGSNEISSLPTSVKIHYYMFIYSW